MARSPTVSQEIQRRLNVCVEAKFLDEREARKVLGEVRGEKMCGQLATCYVISYFVSRKMHGVTFRDPVSFILSTVSKRRADFHAREMIPPFPLDGTASVIPRSSEVRGWCLLLSLSQEVGDALCEIAATCGVTNIEVYDFKFTGAKPWELTAAAHRVLERVKKKGSDFTNVGQALMSEVLAASACSPSHPETPRQDEELHPYLRYLPAPPRAITLPVQQKPPRWSHPPYRPPTLQDPQLDKDLAELGFIAS
jgi:hypothetical protein